VGRLILLWLVGMAAFGCRSRGSVGSTDPAVSSVTLHFVAAGRGRLQGNPCSKKGGLAPLVTFLRSTPADLVIVGDGNVAGTAHEPATTAQKARRAELLCDALKGNDKTVLFPGSHDGLQWPLARCPRVVRPLGVRGHQGELIMNASGILIASYDEGTLSTHVARITHQQRVRRRLKDDRVRLLVGVVSGSRRFLLAVAALPDAPGLLLWSDPAGHSGTRFTQGGSVVLSSKGLFEEVLTVTLELKGRPGEPLASMVTNTRREEEIRRVQMELAGAGGDKARALTRRLELLKVSGPGSRAVPRGNRYQVIRHSLLEVPVDPRVAAMVSVEPLECPAMTAP